MAMFIQTKSIIGISVSVIVALLIFKFGVFVELEKDIEGLVHKSEMGKDDVDDLNTIFKVGDDIKVKVIKIYDIEKKIGLSMKGE